MKVSHILGLLLLAPVPLVLAAPERPPGLTSSEQTVRRQLHSVIEGQLQAFRSGDYGRAYSFASAAIRRRFAREQFTAMVRAGYPAIVRSRSVRFGPVFDDGRRALVQVIIGDDDGEGIYAYELVREGRSWKVNGVVAAERTRFEGEVAT